MSERRLKVLWCLNTWRGHWLESWVAALAAELARRSDVELVVWTCEKARPGVGEEIAALGVDLVHVHGTEGAWAGVDDFGGVQVVVSLQGILTALEPFYPGGLSWLETLRDFRPLEFLKTHHSIHRAARIWRWRFAPRERAFLRRVDVVFGRTQWDRSWAAKLAPAARYVHVGEALRSPFYAARGTWRPPREKIVYAGAAFAYPLKGGHVLVRALKAVLAEVGDVRLHVADARGASQYHRYLDRLAKRLGVAERIVRLPRLSSEEIVAELRQAAVCVVASFLENSPNTVAEALEVGTPVVASAVGGVPEMLGEDSLVRPGDAEALAAKIVERLRAPASVPGRFVPPRAHEVADELLAAYRDVRFGPRRIAVLMTCHNRRETTVRCLRRLLPQLGAGSRVFLVDDGSDDGTGEAVRRLFGGSQVRLIPGDGTLFWAKGMSLAWETAAAEGGWDGCLWLNDDAMLNEDALAKLFAADDRRSLVVGQLVDATGREVYGLGVNGWMNGNFVYVPRRVAMKVGTICGAYAHAWADSDYAQRCRRRGVAIKGCGVVGVTGWHPLRPALNGTSLGARWRLLFDPKGWNLHDLWLYRRRNWTALHAVVSCTHLILKVLFGK